MKFDIAVPNLYFWSVGYLTVHDKKIEFVFLRESSEASLTRVFRGLWGELFTGWIYISGWKKQ